MDKRLLDLRNLVRSRLERDLRLLAQISEQQTQLSLQDILDEVQAVYVHYIKINALLDNASGSISRGNTRLQEALNRLRQAE